MYFLALVKEVRKDFDIKIVMPEGSNQQLIKFIEEENVEYECFSPPFITDQSDSLAGKFRLHKSKIESEFAMLKFLDRYDLESSIVHIEIAPWQSLLSVVWLSLRTNVFVTLHNSLPDPPLWRYLLWKLKLRAVSRFDTYRMFAANKDAKNRFKGLFSDEKLNEIVVTYANVNPREVDEALSAEINRDKLCDKYNLPKNKFLVFCVGQFIDRKGRWIFLEAARELLKKNDDIAFVWISNSKPSDSDMRKANGYGLGEGFTLITSDQIGNEHIDLFKLLRLADLFALVSYVEGLPISLLEAMALGIPSVSTNINGIPEAVKHMETGWLIEPGDSYALVNAIKTLKDDSKLRQEISETGRNYVLKVFNKDVVAKIASDNYKKALK